MQENHKTPETFIITPQMLPFQAFSKVNSKHQAHNNTRTHI